MASMKKAGNLLRVVLIYAKCLTAECLWRITGNRIKIPDTSIDQLPGKQVVEQIFEPRGLIFTILP